MKTAKTAYYQAESTATGSPVSVEVQDKFWSQVDTLNNIDNSIKTDFENIKIAASAFATKKAQKLASDIAAINISNVRTQSSATKDPVLKDIKVKQEQLGQLRDQKVSLDQTILSATKAKSDLSAPTVVTNVNVAADGGDSVSSKTSTVVASLTTLGNHLNAKSNDLIISSSKEALIPIQGLVN